MAHKVSWPTWKELQSSTVLVLVASVIFSVLIFLMDYAFGINTASADDTGFVWKGILGYFYDAF